MSRKLLMLIIVVVVAVLALATGANAEEKKYVTGGFEISGHINTGFGFDYIGSGAATVVNGTNTANGNASGMARDGWSNFRPNTNHAKDWGFLLDEIELSITKSFGDVARLRADIAFGDRSIGSPWQGVYIKQVYATVNIPAGNGLELLAGRFDAPIGYEAVDRNDNNTVTHSMLYNFNVRPRSLTGLKFYYAFDNGMDVHLWFANNLMDGIQSFNFDNKLMPAVGTRVGYTWGEEGRESTLGLSAALGEDVDAGSAFGRLTYLMDIDWNIWATDEFVIGGEGIFRRNNAASGSASTMIFGGIVDMNYTFSDAWDATLKYAVMRTNNGNGTADATDLRTIQQGTTGGVANNYALTVAKGYLQEISLSPCYQIADGAKFRVEYRLDWTGYSGFSKNLTQTVVGLFEYAF